MNSVLRRQMDAQHKKILKAISLELRHLLEGQYDASGKWQPGDLERRLAAIGVRRDREPVNVDELAHLTPADQKARPVVDAYLKLRAVERNSFRSASATSPNEENGMDSVLREQAVAEFVRETAYTWANRLLALRCMEARELIDEVILQKPAYGGRALERHRLAQRQPELCAGEDDGLLATLDKVFAEQARHLPLLFAPEAPGVALKPSAPAIKRCVALLSGTEAVRNQEPATSDVFQAPDALGWAYQYWNTEEKDRVFTKVRTQKGAKIEGADIVPATQLYTEPYMVKFLVQNSLGATWMGMHPESKLSEKWEYYVRDADRVERNDGAHAKAPGRKVEELTFLDPAWLRPRFFVLLGARKLSSLADVRSGLSTGHNDRFLRFSWEVQATSMWRPYSKGGGYGRWLKFQYLRLSVDRCKVFVSSSGRGAIRNWHYQGQQGLTYTENAGGSLGVRLMESGSYFDAKGVSPNQLCGLSRPINVGMRAERLLVEADDRECKGGQRVLGHPTDENGVLRRRTSLEEADVVGIKQILHGCSLPSSSAGRSAWRNARPYSNASRNAASSEMEPATFSSQLATRGVASSRR